MLETINQWLLEFLEGEMDYPVSAGRPEGWDKKAPGSRDRRPHWGFPLKTLTTRNLLFRFSWDIHHSLRFLEKNWWSSKCCDLEILLQSVASGCPIKCSVKKVHSISACLRVRAIWTKWVANWHPVFKGVFLEGFYVLIFLCSKEK